MVNPAYGFQVSLGVGQMRLCRVNVASFVLKNGKARFDQPAFHTQCLFHSGVDAGRLDALRIDIESVEQALFGIAGVLIVLIFGDSNEYSCPSEGTHYRVVSGIPVEGQISTRNTTQNKTNNDHDRL